MTQRSLKIAFLAVCFLDNLGVGLLVPILPQLQHITQSSVTAVAWLASAYPLAQGLGGWLLARLSDRFGRAMIVAPAAIVSGVASIVCGCSASFPVLLLARLASGFAAGNVAVVQAHVIDVTAVDDRQAAFGQIGSAAGLGFIVGLVLSTAAGLGSTRFVTVSLPFLALGAAQIAAGLAIGLGAKGPHVEAAGNKGPTAGVHSGPAPRRLALLGIHGLATMVFIGGATLAPFQLTNAHGFSQTLVGAVFVAQGVVLVATQILIVPALRGARAAWNATFGGFSLLWLLMLAMSSAPSAIVFAGLTCTAGIAYAILMPVTLALITQDVSRGREGELTGRAAAASCIGSFAGPFLAGLGYGVFGPGGAFGGLAAVAFAAVSLAILTRQRAVRASS